MNFIMRLKRIRYCLEDLWLELKIHVDLIAFRKDWRLKNKNNGTIAVNKFDMEKVTVGDYTYGELKVLNFDNPKERLIIGKYCSIAHNVTFLLGGEHNLHNLILYPYSMHILHRPTGPTPTKGEIIVEDDVWIGTGATILSGVKLGKGSVVAANSIVTKDVPPYHVYINGKTIKKRFSDNIINKIKNIDLDSIQKLDAEKQDYILNNEITDENVDKITYWLKF